MPRAKNYREVLKALELPKDMPDTRVCKSCGKTMHILKINKHVAYWMHNSEDIETCGEVNPIEKGRPLIIQNWRFYNNLKALWELSQKNVCAPTDKPSK